MNKIFRTLRLTLLKDHQFGRYIFYAIGEIILVVIGIVIALQINNWNENKKSLHRETIALKELSSDLSDNIEELKYLVEGEERESLRLQSLRELIGALMSSQAYHDTLSVDFYLVLNMSTVQLKNSAFEILKSSGIDLISDDELRSAIGSYYTSFIPLARGISNELRDDFYHYLLDYLRKDFVYTEFEMDEERQIGIRPKDYEELLRKQDFLQSLNVYYPILSNFVFVHERLLEEAQSLKHIIDEIVTKRIGE